MAKTTNEYMGDVIKYAGPSAGVGFAIAQITSYLIPNTEKIESAIAILSMFLVNTLLVLLKSRGIIYQSK